MTSAPTPQDPEAQLINEVNAILELSIDRMQCCPSNIPATTRDAENKIPQSNQTVGKRYHDNPLLALHRGPICLAAR